VNWAYSRRDEKGRRLAVGQPTKKSVGGIAEHCSLVKANCRADRSVDGSASKLLILMCQGFASSLPNACGLGDVGRGHPHAGENLVGDISGAVHMPGQKDMGSQCRTCAGVTRLFASPNRRADS